MASCTFACCQLPGRCPAPVVAFAAVVCCLFVVSCFLYGEVSSYNRAASACLLASLVHFRVIKPVSRVAAIDDRVFQEQKPLGTADALRAQLVTEFATTRRWRWKRLKARIMREPHHTVQSSV